MYSPHLWYYYPNKENYLRKDDENYLSKLEANNGLTLTIRIQIKYSEEDVRDFPVEVIIKAKLNNLTELHMSKYKFQEVGTRYRVKTVYCFLKKS